MDYFEDIVDYARLPKKPVPAYDFESQGEDQTQNYAELLAGTLVAHRGLGLASPQVGINARVFAVGDPDQPEDVMVFFNPTIIHYSDEQSVVEEGCLSYPGMYIKIKRPAVVRMRYQDVKGETHTQKFTGMTARVIQHEIDHLDGVMFTKRASRIHLEQAKRQMKKLRRERKRNKHILEDVDE